MVNDTKNKDQTYHLLLSCCSIYTYVFQDDYAQNAKLYEESERVEINFSIYILCRIIVCVLQKSFKKEFNIGFFFFNTVI